MIRDGSKSFFLASLLLPQAVRDPARSLYAFCRLADDKVDLAKDSAAAVAALTLKLDHVYRGGPLDHPAERAFADVVADHAIPRALPEALIEGFAWDAEGRGYDTISDLRAYAVRVAGAVGVMMALLMETRSPEAIARACDLGVAMQLTNIARDVGEDARNGRLYLPRQWLAEEGIEPEAFLAQPKMSPALARVIARLLGEAARLYARATPGIGLLPRACRPAIHAARLLYAEIGGEVTLAGHDSVSRRATVSRARKAMLLAKALTATAGSSGHQPVLPEAASLAAAVAAAPQPPPRQRGVDARAQWLVELFMRLERQRS